MAHVGSGLGLGGLWGTYSVGSQSGYLRLLYGLYIIGLMCILAKCP